MTASSGPPAGDTHELVDHLFRSRAGQMVAWLTRVFGPANLELAEEVVQDALLKALQQWPHTGIPDNPAGWKLESRLALAQLAPRADEPLRDGRLGHQERTRDFRHAEAADGLEAQRDARVARQVRMTAEKHHPQLVVVERAV